MRKFEGKYKAEIMAPKVKRSKNTPEDREMPYQRLAGQVCKKKTFLNRINFEKCLPLKKRLFPIEFACFQLEKPRFKPTPYEKPVTRSQGRRSVVENSSNKENQAVQSTANAKVNY